MQRAAFLPLLVELAGLPEGAAAALRGHAGDAVELGPGVERIESSSLRTCYEDVQHSIFKNGEAYLVLFFQAYIFALR